jgi:hypothetical protein
LIFINLLVITGNFFPFTENLLLPVNEILYRTIITTGRILARQNWHFSNANQHLIIENQYFSNAEQHLDNPDRILALQNWHYSNAN